MLLLSASFILEGTAEARDLFCSSLDESPDELC